MPWTIKLSSKAEGYFKRLAVDVRAKIKSGLLELAESDSPRLHRDVRRLTGRRACVRFVGLVRRPGRTSSSRSGWI